MVDQVATKEEASNGAHGEMTNERKVTQGNKDFRKKGFKSNNDNKRYEGVPDQHRVHYYYLQLMCSVIQRCCTMYKRPNLIWYYIAIQ